MSASSSLQFYKEIKPTIDMSIYLEKLTNVKHRRAISKIRLSSQNLNIELGRHRQIERNNRKCTFCDLDELEDEYHIILKCPQYGDIRTKYIKKYYYTRPSTFKLVQLFQNDHLNIKNLARYVIEAFKHKNSSVNANT